MHDLLLVDLFEAIDELLQDQACFILSEATLLLLQVGQVPTIAQLHYQVEVVLCPLQVYQLYHIGAFNLCEYVDFIFEIIKFSLI